jgi:hypothetical protein
LAQEFLDTNPIRVAPECHDTTRPCLFASWYYWPECRLSKSDKGMHKMRNKMPGIEIHYLVCLLRVELHRVAGSLGYSVDGTYAMHPSQSSGSLSLLFHRASWVNIVDVCVQPLLVVNGTSHSSGGEEVEAHAPPCSIPNVGSERSVQFYLYGINSEVPNRSPCSLGL